MRRSLFVPSSWQWWRSRDMKAKRKEDMEFFGIALVMCAIGIILLEYVLL